MNNIDFIKNIKNRVQYKVTPIIGIKHLEWLNTNTEGSLVKKLDNLKCCILPFLVI